MKSTAKTVLKRIIVFFVLAYVVAAVALLLFTIITLVRCNQAAKTPKTETCGNFLYTVVYYDADGNRVIKDKGVRSGIMIMGLSETGKEKETIAVPEYINDLKVEQLGYSKMWGNEGAWESEKLKKLIICTPVPMISGIFKKCINLEKIILLSHDKINDTKWGNISVYLTSYHYAEEHYTTNYFEFYDGCGCYFSNVSYRYNYDNASNDGYYWIDDCDYGSRIEYIPETPVREGYTFDGWYKQSECIDEWDFEADTLPQARYTEENEEIYQETRLYAKWIKN